MDKRGISPLLSTLVLIAISIGLGAVVMSWGRGYIEERAEFVQVKALPQDAATFSGGSGNLEELHNTAAATKQGFWKTATIQELMKMRF